jgi:hypothetical protein
MSVHYETDRRRFVVRWREDGRQRSKRFRTEPEAVEFDAGLGGPQSVTEQAPATLAAGDGVYAYATRDGVRYRFLSGGPTDRCRAVAASRAAAQRLRRDESWSSRSTAGRSWSVGTTSRPSGSGHRSITTTEEHYGHLEGSFVKDAAARTEAAIWATR